MSYYDLVYFVRDMKIELEIFPAGTDSHYIREVSMSWLYTCTVVDSLCRGYIP